jgi:phosphate transport system permease protein
MSSSVRTKDLLLKGITYAAAFVSLFTLLLIVGYVFTQGFHLLNLDLITHDYKAVNHIAAPHDGVVEFCECDAQRDLDDDVFYSRKWGLALRDDKDLEGNGVVLVDYVHPDSPFNGLVDKGVQTEEISLDPDDTMIRIAFEGAPSTLSRFGAERMIAALDAMDSFRELEFQTAGGGIRGSIITTLYLIVMTLLFALPVGIGAALYLNEFAPNTRFTRMLRSFIETLTGVPSIIYGLMGLAIFVPLTVNLTRATGGNIISGALTLAVILLPVVIRTTEESLKVVPDDYRHASLALGASRTQTTFKVVLPNAAAGILTATLLAIGRIIGESAALVFAIGTLIKDEITLTGKSTSLAVHIWAMMSDEPANVELSSTIAIIILVIVLSMNISIKFITKRMLGRIGVRT